MLVEQDSHVRFAQLKILRGEAETGSDGLSGLAIVLRGLCLLCAANAGQRKIVIGFGLSWGRLAICCLAAAMRC